MAHMFPFVQPTFCGRRNEHTQSFYQEVALVLSLDTDGTYMPSLPYRITSLPLLILDHNNYPFYPNKEI